MITTLITNFLAFLNSSSWITKLFTLLILWFTPALELFTLLMVIMTVDFLLDIWLVYKKSKASDNIKQEIWEATKLFLTKVFFYSILVLLMNGLQLHLIKDSFNLFRWVVAIPIISESFGVMSTIETYTGIKVIDSIKKLLKNIMSREGVDESIIDDIKHIDKKDKE